MNANEFKFIRNGKVTEASDAKNAPILTAVNDGEIQNTIYIFDSEDDFDKWARQSKYLNEIEQGNKIVDQTRQEENKDDTDRRKQIQKLTENANSKLSALSEEIGLPLSSIELLTEV